MNEKCAVICQTQGFFIGSKNTCENEGVVIYRISEWGALTLRPFGLEHYLKELLKKPVLVIQKENTEEHYIFPFCSKSISEDGSYIMAVYPQTCWWIGTRANDQNWGSAMNVDMGLSAQHIAIDKVEQEESFDQYFIKTLKTDGFSDYRWLTRLLGKDKGVDFSGTEDEIRIYPI